MARVGGGGALTRRRGGARVRCAARAAATCGVRRVQQPLSHALSGLLDGEGLVVRNGAGDGSCVVSIEGVRRGAGGAVARRVVRIGEARGGGE